MATMYQENKKLNSTIIVFIFFLLCLSQIAWNWGSRRENNEGIEAFQNKNYEQAKQDFLASHQKDIKNEIPVFNLALTQTLLDDKKNAQNYFEQATLSNNNEIKSKSFFALGNLNFENKNWKEAVEAYKKSLDIDPLFDEAKYNLELALHYLNQQSDTKPEEPDKDSNQNQDTKNNEQKQQDQEETDSEDQKSQKQENNKSKESQDDSSSSSDEQNQEKTDAQDQKSKEQEEPKQNQSQDPQPSDEKPKDSLSQNTNSPDEKKSGNPVNSGNNNSTEKEKEDKSQIALQEIMDVLDAIENEEKENRTQVMKMRAEFENKNVQGDW